MSACPQCGKIAAAGARACTACGRLLPAPAPAPAGRGAAQRTLLGGLDATAHIAAPQPGPAASPQRTLLGVARPFGEPGHAPGASPAPPSPGAPAHPFGGTQRIDPAPAAPPAPTAAGAHAIPARRVDPWTDPVHALPTLVDPRPLGAQVGSAKAGLALPTQLGRETLEREIGRAQGRGASVPPLEELGATQGPQRARMVPAARPSDPAHPLGRRRIERARAPLGAGAPAPNADAPGRARERAGRQGLLLAALALLLVVVAVVVVLVWPSPPPLEARVRAADDAQEVVDVSCASCPDGTVLKLRDVEATVRGGQAVLPLPAPLSVGDTPVRISIDRPEGGRDETVQIPLRVAYRVRPDLSSLDADQPQLRIVVETHDDAKVELDGEVVPVRAGRAIKSIDVAADLAGAAELLSRKVSYAVTPPDGAEERGVVSVTVSVLPLSIDAPGRAVVTDQSSFLLAGRTAPGAEIVVAGRAIPVAQDGGFAQHMNVSSVGTTQIEVRARAPGKAPRIRQIVVQRVSDLEETAKAFRDAAEVSVESALTDPKAALGKRVAIEGVVLERSSRPHQTVFVVESPVAARLFGAERGVVRLVQGGSIEVERGAKLRAHGVVAGTVKHGDREVLDVDVAFSLTGDAPPAPGPQGFGGRR